MKAYPNGHPKWFFGLFDMHCKHDRWYYEPLPPLKDHGPFAPEKHQNQSSEGRYIAHLRPTCCICGKTDSDIYKKILSEREYLTKVAEGSIVNSVSR